MNDDIRYIYVGLVTVLITFAAVIAVLFSFASGPVAAVTTTVPTVTTSTSVVDELIPAISITIPPPPLTQRAAYFVLDTRNRT